MKDAHASERLLLQGRKNDVRLYSVRQNSRQSLRYKRQNDRRGSPYETKAADCRRF